MGKLKQQDWDQIEAIWRTNTRTNPDVAAEFGITESAIRKRAQRKGWQRDLTEQVRQQVKAELVRSEVSPSADKSVSDKEIVEAAGKKGAEIVTIHRNTIESHIKRLENLTEYFDRTMALEKRRQDAFEALLAAEDPAETLDIGKELNQSLKFVGSAAAVSATISNNLRSLVSMQRQAYNLDDPDQKDDLPTMIIHDPSRPDMDL